MNKQQIAELAPRFNAFLKGFRPLFATGCGFAHLGTNSWGLPSDLARKSAEPIALAPGCAVRTIQEFLTFHAWDEGRMRDRLQLRLVARDMPAPGMPLDSLGAIGLVDETSTVKKGTKTPGVQRQYYGAASKIEDCIVTVHPGYLQGDLKTLIDSDLFLPESWSLDRDRCRQAHIPDSGAYRAKWRISLKQIAHAIGNGVRFG
jgi:SRSO17 transposase